MNRAVVVDANVWIAYINTDDSCHKQAKEIIEQLILVSIPILVSALVVQEVCSVLMKKIDVKTALYFYTVICTTLQVKMIPANREWFDETAELLAKMKPRKALSYTDYSLMVMAREFGAQLITFDKKLSTAYRHMA